MSRRTRIKMRKNQEHSGLGTSHHNQYASSISYFPKSYSILGKEVKFPSTAVPFLVQGKLTFYGSLQLFQQKISALNNEDYISIHTANIGIRGKLQQKMSQVNNCIFGFSMILCCVSQLFSTSFYRNKFFTKYSFEILNYKRVLDILKKMDNLQTVMFTFQDNLINQQKLSYLDESFSTLRINSLTLRNLSYFMWPKEKITAYQGQIYQFNRLKKSKMEFIFVWEKHSLHYNSKQLDEEKQSITASLCDDL